MTHEAHPLDPFIYSPTRGILAPFQSFSSIDLYGVDPRDELLMERLERQFLNANYLASATTLALLIALPTLVAIAITRALFA